MASAKKPKSVLKKGPYPATAPKSKEERDRDVALYHANLIQQRKDVELTILRSLEELIEFPLAGAPYHAASPSSTDAAAFKEHLRPFQPSDYDDLILERNINDKCGYTLCSAPNKKEAGGGVWRLAGMNGRAKDFKIVQKEELEKWCSAECAKRALYVRVQLAESAAWEREPRTAATIDLLDEPQSDVLYRLQNLNLTGEDADSKMQGVDSLALERGDRGHAGSARNGLVDVNLQERTSARPAQAPSLIDDLGERMDGMQLEGHIIRFGTRDQELFGTDEDDEDNDWAL